MRIDLASEPDFRLGPMRVSPSTREVFAPAGREVLEPRVMMVLVALARADGQTVSRDALIDSCWDGLAVGDDAINRVIGKLRKLAAASATFEIETITKVGYRLRSEDGEVPGKGRPARTVSGPSMPRVAIAGSVAVLVAAVLLSAVVLTRRAPPETAVATAQQLDPETTALIERGRAAISEHASGRIAQGVAQLQEATVKAPDSALAWGALALGYSLSQMRTPPEEQPALVRRGEEAVARALALDPRQPEAIAAKAIFVKAYGQWLQKEQLDRAAYDNSEGRYGSYLRFLHQVGRGSEALSLSQKTIATNPGALTPQVGRSVALVAAGRMEEADRATADLVRLWPQNYLAWFNRAHFLMYNGRAPEAVAFIDDRSKWPSDIPPSELALTGQMARAIASSDPAEADIVVARYNALAPQGQGYIENAIRISAALGRADDAFRFARLLYLSPADQLPRQRFAGQRNFVSGTERITDLLFTPPMDRLHGDPRFLELVTQMGLVEYWVQSGTTPDFCRKWVEPCRQAGIRVPAVRPDPKP
jgi:DNA-binding winged helix-turn-helix (wHTH) protein/tetratricopeptide (TPR) repeat protein